MEVSFILKYVRTTEEKNEIINLLEEMIENNFKNTPIPITASPYSKRISELITSEINSKNITNNREEIEKFLEALREQINSLSEMRLAIAITPTEDLIKKLKNWAQLNNIPNIIFNLEKKSNIVAGAIIMTHEGEYVDYSLSNQLDKYFSEKKQEILTLL